MTHTTDDQERAITRLSNALERARTQMPGPAQNDRKPVARARPPSITGKDMAKVITGGLRPPPRRKSLA